MEIATRWVVARQIGQHGLRSGERRLGVDEPVLPPQRSQEGIERLRFGEMCAVAEELEMAGSMGLSELGQEEPAEQPTRMVGPKTARPERPFSLPYRRNSGCLAYRNPMKTI
ncbi:hypothetical protein MES5069_900004 [Mesorhizobium escarrei]|uniref:Transposase TnpC homeodomain domain-containing protein n=1 Tax=Mesorhizobium escarrei TaxID=666018 RepID=A0ABM9EJN1_9HYPH|nr:hypothetical protein MES5069_900004 [Mesorhizobium escarrei]